MDYFQRAIFCTMVIVLISRSVSTTATDAFFSTVTKRSSSPPETCTSRNEAETFYSSVDPSMIWICKNAKWAPFELVASTGKTRALSGKNCKEIQEALSTGCTLPPQSGVYWVSGRQNYCDMTTDGGGWTLVWQHTYMKYNPLYRKMFYYSDFLQPCVKDASHEEWCNVPNKASFNPTEQMIVGYHKGTMVFAYKGYFNHNIDYHWTGAFLFEPKKVLDKCVINNGVPPAPSVHLSGLLGLTFDKASPTNYYLNCNTYERETTLVHQNECRWHDCHLPSSISSKRTQTDMTMAIFVR